MRKRVLFITRSHCIPPKGAEARRARCLARALSDAGCEVTVLHSIFSESKYASIMEHNIRYCYPFTNEKLIRAGYAGKLIKTVFSYIAFVFMLFLVRQKRAYDVVYLYTSELFVIKLVLTMLNKRIPIVKEICEWYPSIPSCPPNKKKYYLEKLLSRINGAVVISRFIEKTVTDIKSIQNPDIPLLKIPILYENVPEKKTNECRNHFIWHGDCRGYLDLILFLLRAYGYAVRMNPKNLPCLVIAGISDKETDKKIDGLSREIGISDKVEIVGFLEETTLDQKIYSSIAAVLPLFDDERSAARFPTKLAEYLCRGIPVIASKVGEVGLYLKDEDTAVLVETQEAEVFGKKMIWAFENKDKISQIGLNGKKLAKIEFYYKSHMHKLDKYISQISNMQK